MKIGIWMTAAALMWLIVSVPPGRAASAETLTLDRAVELAMESHPTLDQLKAAVEKTGRLLEQAKAAYRPTLDYQFEIGGYLDEAGDNFITRFQDNGKFVNQFTLYQTVYDAKRKPMAKAQADQLEASRLELERFREQLRYQVTAAFVQAYLAKEAVTVETAGLDYFADLKRDAKVRLDEGAIPKTDYLTFANGYDQARLQLAALERDYQAAVLALEQATHREIGPGAILEFPDLSAAADALPGQEALAGLKGRKDIRALEARIDALGEQVRQARADKGAVVTAGVNYQHSENAISDLDFSDDTTRVFGRANWRLMDGGLRDQKILQLAAEQMEARARLENLEWSARIEALNALLKMQDARRRLEILQGIVSDAGENLELLTLRYKEGLITATIITDAEVKLRRARLNRIQLQAALALGAEEFRLAGGETRETSQ